MSDTPETEKLNRRLDYSLTDAYLLMTQHARKLERERDEAIQARKVSAADWLNQIANADLRVTRIKRERDEWKEVAEGSLLGAIKERDEAVRSCQIWQQGHSKIVEDRDYWRAEAERWRDCHHEIIADRDWLILELVEISSTADNCEVPIYALAKIGVITHNILNGRSLP